MCPEKICKYSRNNGIVSNKEHCHGEQISLDNLIAFLDKILKLVFEGDVVKVMDLSCSKILNRVTCDVQLDKLVQTASDSSCATWIKAIIETG